MTSTAVRRTRHHWPTRALPLPPRLVSSLHRHLFQNRHTQHRCHSDDARPLGPSPEDVQSARTYCTSLLRTHDASSYTLLAFVPAAARDAYIALRALNVSTARLTGATTTSSAPTIAAALRTSFWRDAVSQALVPPFAPPREPVATLLAGAAAALARRTDGASRLPRAWALRVVATREAHQANPPFRDLAALEAYAEATYATLLYLTLAALPLASVTADHLASHVGKAQGIAAVLRGLPFVAFPGAVAAAQAGAARQQQSQNQQGSVRLPLDVMYAAGVREEDVFRRRGDAAGLRDAVFAVATRANDHLITARQMLATVRAGGDIDHAYEHADDDADAAVEHRRGGSSSGGNTTARDDANRAFGVLMPALATQMWLDRLQQYDFDVFRPELSTADWRLPWKAFWAARRKQF